MAAETTIDCLGLFLTRRCNLACTYCCSETGRDPADKLTLDQLKDAMLQARAMGARRIVIPGEGEPMLDEYLFPLIEFAAQRGIGTTLFTNGVAMDRESAAQLAARDVTVVYKVHSLDSHRFDQLAGKKGAVQWEHHDGAQMPRGLKLLLEAGYGRGPLSPLNRFLIIETVVARQNLAEVPTIARFAKKLGVGCMVETLLRGNRAERNAGAVAVTEEEERRVFHELRRTLGWRFQLRQMRRCRFETNPFLDVSGNIRRCFSLTADIGNIKRTSLSELHEAEQHSRRESGLLSPRLDMRHMGFRCCASRVALKPVRP